MKEDIFEALKDRLEGWELVEMLGLSVEDILTEFEEQVLDNIDDIKELLGIDNDNE